MRRVTVAALAVGMLSTVLPAYAGTVDVSISGFAFQPASVSISAGDTVRWTNRDGVKHTVTSDDTIFDSGALSPGAQFAITFPMPGEYKYHCNIHQFMSGTIVVGGSEVAPPAPDAFQASPGTLPGQIALTWRQNAVGAATYSIYRGTSHGGEAYVASTSATSYTDASLSLLTTYFYEVTASNAVGESPRSGEACAKPFPWLAQLGC